VSTWDFLWNANGAGLSADLSDDTFFQVDFVDSDFGADVTLTVQDGDSSASVLLVTPGGPISLVYAFASFVGIDFSNVQAIRLTVAGEPNGDYAIEQVVTDGGTVIPAPGAFAGGMVLMGVMGMIRRRRA
jgi:hypothetical protein